LNFYFILSSVSQLERRRFNAGVERNS